MADHELSNHLRLYRNTLVENGLWVDNPAEFEGLCERLDIDSGIDPSFPAIKYDTRLSTREKVRCSLCPQRQWHNDGYILRNSRGQIGLVGNVCGASHFDALSWEILDDQHRIRSRRAIGTAVRAEGLSKLAQLEELVGRWIELTNIVGEFQRECLDWFDDAKEKLRRLENLGWLFGEEDLSAELRRTLTQIKLVRESWVNHPAPWTAKDREVIAWLGRSIVTAHRKHAALVKSLDDPDRYWSFVAEAACYSGSGARFFYKAKTRSIRVTEFEGGGANFRLPESLEEPPVLDDLIDLLPTIPE